MMIEEFQSMNMLEKVAITKHARKRLTERRIQVDDIISAIDTGEIIKEYIDDKPLPSCLILGKAVSRKMIHVVVSKDEEFIYLITAYFPDKEQWEEDLRTRKER